FFTHLRRHLIAAGRVGELPDLLTDLFFLEAKAAVGLVFDLAGDFTATVAALDTDHPWRWRLGLLDEALRRDIHFIARHAEDYLQGLFQSLSNSCWWYDTPDAAVYYDLSNRTWKGPLPWELPVQHRLAPLLERWRAEREQRAPGFSW